jgi:hypothetical protein
VDDDGGGDDEKDIVTRRSMQYAREKERAFFASVPAYVVHSLILQYRCTATVQSSYVPVRCKRRLRI